jgi:3-oxoacyl-[acyl-carrier protein] reductase
MTFLQDAIAIVTGGARGIGRAIVDELAHDGADVVVFDLSFPDDFPAFADGLRALGRRIESKTVDITVTADAERACEEVLAAFGRIDILVNNAGITRDRLLVRMSDEEWDAVIRVNLKGAFNMTRVAARAMVRQRSGRIVNISSVIGLMGNIGQANYAASKAGLIGFSKAVARELAGRSVTVNCVAPGFVETEMTAALSEEQRSSLLSLIPLKRGSKPEEIAGIVAFLASEKSSYITGQVICVDGGMAM